MVLKMGNYDGETVPTQVLPNEIIEQTCDFKGEKEQHSHRHSSPS
jgi:hypothetical protein